LFGSSTPAPTTKGGILFGATKTLAQRGPGGIFGSDPALTGGLFGTAPAHYSGGIFSSGPAPGAFSLSSQPQQQQQLQQPQIPAQAASLQAQYYAALAREEEVSVMPASIGRASGSSPMLKGRTPAQMSPPSSTTPSPVRRFRSFQLGQWAEKYEDLYEYRQKNGHCQVPHTYKEDLHRWVKRQRHQYKLMLEGKPSSTMTPNRVKMLEEIGFIWDSQGVAWGERLGELKEFKSVFLHCNVTPSNCSENSRLATWVKCQRRQYKLHSEGKASSMTLQRIHVLEKLGLEWGLH
jgi:hypothetical protein